VVILRQESLLVGRSRLYIVNAFDVRDVGQSTCIRQTSVLINRFLLDGGQVRKRIVAGVVVVAIMPDISAKGKDHVRIDQACPGRGDVVGLDFRALIGGANRFAIGTCNPYVEVVIGIWRLKPRSREPKLRWIVSLSETW
jgi:hypothetical protein